MCQKDQQAQDNHAPMIVKDISGEEWREYEWTDPATGKRIVHRLVDVKQVHFYQGCTTHRVVTGDGVAHCVPAVGMYGCTLRWKNRTGPLVKF